MISHTLRSAIAATAVSSALALTSAYASSFSFTTGAPDGRMATASRPSDGGKIEIEAADDFILSSKTAITSATFTGLLTGAAPTVGTVDVEIYRVFPLDSTSPPSGNVLTRVNSPSDVAFGIRSILAGTLNFTTTTLNPTFSAANSVLNGINKFPNQTTGGEGAVSGTEVQFDVDFTTAFNLPAGQYFFIPQVAVTGGEFLWLSTDRSVPLFVGDLQEWIRNANLDPDWSRVGTDIVGGATAPTFNATFSLNGHSIVPDSGSTFALLAASLGLLELMRKARKRLVSYRSLR